MLSGRLLRDREPQKTVVINQAVARQFWPNTNPVGQTTYMGPGLGPAIETGVTEIVGVVGDVRERLNHNAPPTLYQTPLQIPDAAMALITGLQAGAVLVRTQPAVDPVSVSREVEQALLAGDGLPAARIQTMQQVSLDSTGQQNFNLLLLGLFAAIALLLAAVGIYGVLSYSVEQRTHEIGIRAALGAVQHDTVALVLRQALGMTLAGVAAGIAASFALTRLLSTQLYGVKPSDPFTFALAPLVLIAVALFAAYVPALRASRADPIVALRE